MKKSILENVAEISGIPKDYIMDLPRITMLGGKEVQVENYKGLVEYTSETVRLACNNKQLVISGQRLRITRICEQMIFIMGNISNISICSKNNK